jgi:chitinase
VDQCGAPTAVGGIFDFWGLVDGGFLDVDGTAAKGIQYRFDGCSQMVSDFIMQALLFLPSPL